MKCVWWAVLVMTLGGRGLARQPRPRCPPNANSCFIVDEENKNPSFLINGTKLKYEFTDGKFFNFKCPQGITLDDPRLPRFKPALQVRDVRLTCPPPATSYKAALSALNVTALDPSDQDVTPPSYSIILELDAMNFDTNVLAATPELRNMSISNMKLNVEDLTKLPVSLEYLNLDNTNSGFVPADVFTRLPFLVEFKLQQNTPVMMEAAGNLRTLSIISSRTLVNLTLPGSLEWLHLFGWAVYNPEPWLSCAGLETLRLYAIAAETLPDGWLVRCKHLRILEILTAKNLRRLPAGVLRGATALEVVKFWDCLLWSLPAGLLDDARALRELNLGRNLLRTLPGDLFRLTQSLSDLNLSDNHLDETVLSIVGAVTSLNVLRLDSNLALDACPEPHEDNPITMQESSALENLKNLTIMSLSETATTRVCPDWRQFPRLQELTLYFNNTTRIMYTDMWFNYTDEIRFGLDSMNLKWRREDYDVVTAASAMPAVMLDLRMPLRCDCELYWAAAALRHPDTFLNDQGAQCEDKRTLYYVPLDDFVCTAPVPCPDGCKCIVREDIALPDRVLKVDCAGAGLQSLPHVDTGPESFAVDLRVARNRIYGVSSEDLPPGLLRLDLRSNSLGLIDNATASALVSRGDLQVFLADNPLVCACRAAAALATMRAHLDIFPDWAIATCANGTALSLAMPLPCENRTADKPGVSGMSGGAVAGLVLGVVAVAALASSLSWLSLRRRMKMLPSRLPPVTYTGEWLYDAFVSFAHADAAIVHELVERLEGGAEPFRLCVHYRDWVPGGWIPTQIAASVRVSRRTVAVVSEAFLRSKWARAEFREAYAVAVESAEPRLVLVFLVDPSRLPLDAELSSYVAGNTYVCWGDAWFWQKLRRALPDPLPRQSNESAAHASRDPSGKAPAQPLLDSKIELASIEQSTE